MREVGSGGNMILIREALQELEGELAAVERCELRWDLEIAAIGTEHVMLWAVRPCEESQLPFFVGSSICLVERGGDIEDAAESPLSTPMLALPIAGALSAETARTLVIGQRLTVSARILDLAYKASGLGAFNLAILIDDLSFG